VTLFPKVVQCNLYRGLSEKPVNIKSKEKQL